MIHLLHNKIYLVAFLIKLVWFENQGRFFINLTFSYQENMFYFFCIVFMQHVQMETKFISTIIQRVKIVHIFSNESEISF